LARRSTGPVDPDVDPHIVKMAQKAHTAAQHSATSSLECPSRRLVGFMPTGMLDWPGMVAATLFLSGCPLRCPYCHNPELITVTSGPETWEDVISHLSLRRGWIDGVVITGGEPTADPDLLPLLEALASRGLRVKIDTNGTRPDVLRDVIAGGLVESVALDVKTLLERYDRVGDPEAGAAVGDSISIVLKAKIPHEFRTTVYTPVIALHELPALASLLAGGELYALQQFRPGRTLSPVADDVTPASPVGMRAAAEACSRHLPTVTKGV